MLNRRLWLTVLMCCLLAFGAAACDDDDDDDGNGGGGTPSASLSGDVAGSFIRNAEVALLGIDGRVIATTTTDENGRYGIDLPGDQQGPFLIRVRGVGPQSVLVSANANGTSASQPFVGPWYSALTNEAALGDTATANVTPLTTIAVWMLRAEAAKGGSIDEMLLQDYGPMVENMATNAFIAGLEFDDDEFIDAFDAFTSPALPRDDMTPAASGALVANRVAMAIARDVLSGVGATTVEAGSSSFAGYLALFGLDLSDGVIDGEIEGFGQDTAAARDALVSEAGALVQNGMPNLLDAIEDRFTSYTAGDIQAAIDNVGQTLTLEADLLGIDTPPAFTVPITAVGSALVANPPAQALLILAPAVIELEPGQAPEDITATSTLRFVVLDGKGMDVTGQYIDKVDVSVLSNAGVSFLPANPVLSPADAGVGYETVTNPFADMTADNTATVSARVLGTSLQGLTADDGDVLITFVQPGATRLPTAIRTAIARIVDNETAELTINLGLTDEPAGQPADNVSGVATLTVNNGWFWRGTPDNVSKSLLGVPFVNGETFEVNYLAPDNVTDTTASFRIDLDDNPNIIGLAQDAIPDDL